MAETEQHFEVFRNKELPFIDGKPNPRFQHAEVYDEGTDETYGPTWYVHIPGHQPFSVVFTRPGPREQGEFDHKDAQRTVDAIARGLQGALEE